MNKVEFDLVVRLIVDAMVGYLVEDYDISLLEALDKVYLSDTYAKLQDKTTGLYRYSSAYVFDYLKRELKLPSPVLPISNAIDYNQSKSAL